MTPGSKVPDLDPGNGEPAGSGPQDPSASNSASELNLDLGGSLTTEPRAARQTPVGSLPDASPDELIASEVAHLFTSLDKTVRARRLYHANNPVYLGFLASLREAFVRIWSVAHSLSVSVEEHGFRWGDRFIPVGEGRENLAFVFYKDGIRFLTFLPTFEDEIERFLDVVQRARGLESNSDDDMVTILWEREFAAFQYSYVDALSEGIDIAGLAALRQGEQVEQVEPEQVKLDLQGELEPETEQPTAMQQGMPSVAASITRDDFEETMYFLDASELNLLREEVEREWQRDLKTDVINALFDRLEDPIPERQTDILRILRQLLPAFLARGDLNSASKVLVELSGVVEQGDVLGPEQAQQGRELFAELNEPAVLTQLLRSLEEGAIDPTGAELGVFLRHLGSQALALLLRAAETTQVTALQARLRAAVEHLGHAHPQRVLELLRSDDEMIALGATRLAGQVPLPSAGSAVAVLLGRPSVLVRRAAVEALVKIRSGTALEALQNALDDEDRDVRIGVARGLAVLRYQPARNRLEAIIEGNHMRDADLTEKIAFFEAFGAVANVDSVTRLDRLLNGKNLLRQKHSPELRACAAMALGRVGTPASRAALDRAADETHPMVRNAVLKALRQEAAAE